MKAVRIRPDHDDFIAYFPASGRQVTVNDTGAKLLDQALNQKLSIAEIAEQIAKDCNVSLSAAITDAKSFFAIIEQELTPGSYNLIEQEQLDVPMGVELELNLSCNLRCRHCFQGDYSSSAIMDKHRAIEILDTLAEAGVFEISLIGGEPLLHPGIIEIMQHCQKLDFSTSITTNATLIDAEMADIIVETGVSVYVSLDGIAEMHDSIRGRGSFSRTERAIKLLLERNVSVDILCTLNALNADRYKDVIDYCKTLGVPCNFNLFKPFKPAHEQLILKPDRFFEICLDLFERRKKGEPIGLSNAAIVSVLSGLPDQKECTATLSGLVIDTNSRMITCPGLVSAGYFQENDLPSFDNNFLETWHNHRTFRQFKENGLVGCQVRSLLFNRDVTKPDPYSAEALKEYLLH